MNNMKETPIIRVLAEQKNVSPSGTGTMFGAWLMAQAEFAALAITRDYANGLVVTRTANFNFNKPINVGDILEVYACIKEVGRTSMTVHISAFAGTRRYQEVFDATMIWVAVDHRGIPRLVKPLNLKG